MFNQPSKGKRWRSARQKRKKEEGDDGLVVLLETLMDLLLGYTLNSVTHRRMRHKIVKDTVCT
jgi:hypothetical protein